MGHLGDKVVERVDLRSNRRHERRIRQGRGALTEDTARKDGADDVDGEPGIDVDDDFCVDRDRQDYGAEGGAHGVGHEYGDDQQAEGKASNGEVVGLDDNGQVCADARALHDLSGHESKVETDGGLKDVEDTGAAALRNGSEVDMFLEDPCADEFSSGVAAMFRATAL